MELEPHWQNVYGTKRADQVSGHRLHLIFPCSHKMRRAHYGFAS
jgi:hypothetical protein